MRLVNFSREAPWHRCAATSAGQNVVDCSADPAPIRHDALLGAEQPLGVLRRHWTV